MPLKLTLGTVKRFEISASNNDMISKIQDVYINVADMKAALTFYTSALGLCPTYESEWWTSLDCGGTAIGLHWTGGDRVPSVAKDDHGASAGATITFRSDNIPHDRALLERHGAKILGENQQPWGHMLVFEDLDGNVLKLMNPK
jgi:predicted enzyme related to lactoylglutathione lyase